MADKIFPASKPTTVKAAGAGTPSTTNATATGTGTKPQIQNAGRPVYRSHPHRQRSRRGCYCYCCLWIIFIFMVLLIISAFLIFLLYRPHRPSFSLSSLQIISQLNLTSSDSDDDIDHLTTRFNLTVVARNRNNKMMFYYDRVSVSIYSNGVAVGEGSIPAFAAEEKSATTLKAVVRGENVSEKKSLALKVEMNAKVKVKIGGYETKKARLKVVCSGMKPVLLTPESATPAVTKSSKCQVDLQVKIWKWII